MYPKTFRGEPSALRNDITPDGMGKTRLYRNFAWWLSIKNCVIQGMPVVESIVSWYFFLSPPRVAGSRTPVDGNRVVQG